MLQWIIIGGGIHGTLLANFLLSSRKVLPHQIQIIDPHPHLLFNWIHCTRNCGMEFLRSTLVHHIDIDPFALKKYSRKAGFRHQFIEPYSRPSLKLFNSHCESVIQKNNLAKLHKQAQVQNIHVKRGYLEVESSSGTLKTKRVLLAIGSGSLSFPEWSKQVGAQHILSPTFHRQKLNNCKNVVVVGGGISAAQTAIAMSKQCPQAKIYLITNHAPNIRRFDSDPGWISGYLRKFHKIENYTMRRKTIDNARYRGSMTKEVATTLKHITAEKKVHMVVDRIENAWRVDQEYILQLTKKDQIVCDHIILATGFDKKCPGKWLQTAIKNSSLPRTECGYPIVDKSLHWGNNVYVSGALSELEIGPVARNIVGARLAAERIVSDLTKVVT
ncbi:NAD(P)-binding domain-containing protein [Candidatus Uabimicrobium sp. HlEnr_7]|uniref:NAD(P)-binding domain-containing protein n=1 Tax=Candidatus Uabimicrobium helgolandensis TaxID=3095367 RepID=UPI0035592492